MQKPGLTLDDAKRMTAAAEAKALAEGWRVAIAVVDDGGPPPYLPASARWHPVG
jgi:glc operon protein GlcG